MSAVAERIYELLPAVYRQRDAEQGGTLKDLVGVIAEQVEALEENLAQSYDDHFIETCTEWVIPYIGDLIGYRTLHGVVPKIASQRSEVANTIAYRRRKGTASMLEQLARDVTGWDARVVEYFDLLVTSQYMNHLRRHNKIAPDMRNWEQLERLEFAFDSIPHTINVRRISFGGGKHNIPNIGIFLWRLNAYPLGGSPAVQVENNRFMFSPLGNNTPLHTRPQSEDEITHIAEPINVPEPISRRVLDDRMEDYYGAGKSFSIFDGALEIPIQQIRACNLSDDEAGEWAHEPDGFIAVDPVLGRIAFPQDQLPQDQVRVTYHYGFSAETGGGQYERRKTFQQDLDLLAEINDGESIQDVIDATDQSGSIQINSSGRFEESLSIALGASQQLEVRAENERLPTLILADEWQITGDDNSELILNGLLISGAALVIPAENNTIRRVVLRHCTLVPGLTLDLDGLAEQPGAVSLRIENENVMVEIDHCIVGSIESDRGAMIEIHDSIIDANASENIALGPVSGSVDTWGGTHEIVNSTIIGRAFVAAVSLASNSLFHARSVSQDEAPIAVLNKQTGCVRFSYVPPNSVVPRCYRCQPGLAVKTAIDAAENQLGAPLSASLRQSITNRMRAQIRPVFSDLRYSRAAYCQLRRACPVEIRTGADDESEMGVFHQLYQAQRETNLKIRLDEYLRFGLEAGIFYET